MTDQELFDTVKAHLLAQNQRSEDEGSHICLYRGPHGAKCAAGCLIPDSMYRDSMEGSSITALRYEGFMLPWAHEQDALVYALQVVHDSYDPRNWPAQLSKVAELCGLRP